MARDLGPKGRARRLCADRRGHRPGVDAQTLADAPDDFFIKPAAIADEVWHVAHQDRCAWSFNVEIRPFRETW